jgi:hypothetical protein
MNNKTGTMFSFVTRKSYKGFWFDCLGSSSRSFLTYDRLDDIGEKIRGYINEEDYDEAVYNLVKDVIYYLGVVPEEKKYIPPPPKEEEEEYISEGLLKLIITRIIYYYHYVIIFVIISFRCFFGSGFNLFYHFVHCLV